METSGSAEIRQVIRTLPDKMATQRQLKRCVKSESPFRQRERGVIRISIGDGTLVQACQRAIHGVQLYDRPDESICAAFVLAWQYN